MSVDRSKNPRRCDLDYCDEPHRAKGFCATHYYQVTRGLELAPIGTRPPRRGPNLKGCLYPQCPDPHKARGYCAYHHYQILKGFPLCEKGGRLGKCACCGRENKKLVWDHDHATGEFRGWICHGCNTGIGKLGDTIEGLEMGIAYLRSNGVY